MWLVWRGRGGRPAGLWGRFGGLSRILWRGVVVVNRVNIKDRDKVRVAMAMAMGLMGVGVERGGRRVGDVM